MNSPTNPRRLRDDRRHSLLAFAVAMALASLLLIAAILHGEYP